MTATRKSFWPDDLVVKYDDDVLALVDDALGRGCSRSEITKSLIVHDFDPKEARAIVDRMAEVCPKIDRFDESQASATRGFVYYPLGSPFNAARAGALGLLLSGFLLRGMKDEGAGALLFIAVCVAGVSLWLLVRGLKDLFSRRD